ncbi:GGDEF domain-containing protein [Alkalibacter mobilis]|uniref:GGDEF domain-containing protein n=1 Tax=Alkalibacter mobilis TaxID=2787712 RepID=UPI00189EBC1E|nr:GGDEF domain-containing protein [Alkalibacter mobilis]MBF7097421.1 GGDEF domain-containing protein [Alkalibacter mobilis]
MRLPKNKNVNFAYFPVIAFIVTLMLLVQFMPSENLRLGQSGYYEINDGWTITSDNFEKNNVTLPFSGDFKKNQVFKATRTFEEDFVDAEKLRLRASMQDARVFLDKVLIFETPEFKSDIFTNPNASLWYLVDLPEDLAGKSLTLEIKTDIKAFSGLINEVAIGDGDALLYDLIQRQSTGIVLALILMVFGISALLLSFFISNISDNRFLYLGIFAIFVSVWVFSEAKLMQLITGNRFLIGGISYMLVAAIPVPFLLFLRDTVLTRFNKLFTWISMIFILDLILNLILQLTGVASFFNTIIVTNSMILVSMVMVVVVMFVEWVKYKNNNAKRFLAHLSLLAVIVLLELVKFFNWNFDFTSVYSSVGTVLFFILLAIDSLKSVDMLIEKEKERKIFERLAFKDILTGGGNRAAYEKDLDSIMNDDRINKFRLIFLDINYLKNINDNFGHQEGDRAIVKCYNCLKDSFLNQGRVYRLGGDEFVCIIENPDEIFYNQGVKRFRNSLDDFAALNPFKIDVAIGSGVFDKYDEIDIKTFFNNIDKLMYENKRYLKKSNVVEG